MNREDIITLAKAGFTAQQIVALLQVQTQAVQPTPPAPPVPPAPAAPPVPPAPPIDPIMTELQKLTGAIQANAIINSNLPGNTQTTEDILAAIIAPPTQQANK